MNQKARIVLGGGAAFGLAHIGVLQVLEEHYEISGIIGTSMGSIIGGLYACGYAPEEILEIATKNNAKRLFNPLNVDRTLSGIFDGKKILKLFGEWTKNGNVEDCRIPFIAISYDLNKRNTIVINKGSVAKAMRASSSIPYLFSPFIWGKYAMVDGGVEYPLPLGLGKKQPDELVIAVNVLPSRTIQPERIDLINSHSGKTKMKLHEVFLRSVMQNQAYLALHAITDNKPDLVIDAYYPQGNVFNFGDAEVFYNWGISKANESVINAKQPNYPHLLRKEYLSLVSKLSKGMQKIVINLEDSWNAKK